MKHKNKFVTNRLRRMIDETVRKVIKEDEYELEGKFASDYAKEENQWLYRCLSELSHDEVFTNFLELGVIEMRVELYKGNVLDGDPLEQEYFSDIQGAIDYITSSYYAAVVFIDGREEECINVLDLWH